MEPNVESICADLRKSIQKIKEVMAGLHDHNEFEEENQSLSAGNIPADRHGNMHANITLAFKALEDARMRCGKVMQACQGGLSILDK